MLTESDLDLIALYVQHGGWKYVANAEGISLHTIKHRAATILLKTGQRNMAGLVARLMVSGYFR